MPDAPPLRPRDVFDALRKTVVGQDEATREVATAVVKHLSAHPSGNLLLIGNSGSGKTTLMHAVENFLSSDQRLESFSNVVRVNANVLAEEHQGRGKSILSRLYRNAVRKVGVEAIGDALRMVERGIVFVDEIDKIRTHVGGVPNVRGIIAQEALLTLMENENVELDIEDPERTTVSIDSSSILFIVGGAFEDLYQSVFHRAQIGTDVAPLRPTVVVSQSGQVREELAFHLRDYIGYEDLFRYGMTPQFVARFDSIVVFNDLGQQDLASIFVEPEKSIFRTSRDYFEKFNVDLQITRGAIMAIAWEASRQKRIGARALKEVFRRIIRDLEFDPSQGNDSNVPRRTLTIDEQMVARALKDGV